MTYVPGMLDNPRGDAPSDEAEEAPYPAWHHLLIQAMETLIQPQ